MKIEESICKYLYTCTRIHTHNHSCSCANCADLHTGCGQNLPFLFSGSHTLTKRHREGCVCSLLVGPVSGSCYLRRNVSCLQRGSSLLSFPSSQAFMQDLHVGAVQAADVAAPVERAVAAFCDLLGPGPIPPPTTQQFAAIQSWGGAVARASSCPCCACLATIGAEVG